MPAGRPPKFDTPKQMQDAIDLYFSECEEKKEPLTISGLAYHLGMATESLRRYENNDKFSATVKRAKQFVEMSIERALISGMAPAGSIFWLKNNAGWKDKTETANTHDMKITSIERTIID